MDKVLVRGLHHAGVRCRSLMHSGYPIGQIFPYRDHVDFRKSIDGLGAIVEMELEMNVFTGALFLFINRGRDKIKILYWSRNGVCTPATQIPINHAPQPRSRGCSSTFLRRMPGPFRPRSIVSFSPRRLRERPTAQTNREGGVLSPGNPIIPLPPPSGAKSSSSRRFVGSATWDRLM